MARLGSRLQSGNNNYMVSEAQEEYALDSAYAAYEDPGKQATMGFMVSGEEYYEAGNYSHCLDQKHTSFTSPTSLENINWETADMCISVAKETIRKATGRVNPPLECWGCTNPPRYHGDWFQTYMN